MIIEGFRISGTAVALKLQCRLTTSMVQIPAVVGSDIYQDIWSNHLWRRFETHSIQMLKRCKCIRLQSSHLPQWNRVSQQSVEVFTLCLFSFVRPWSVSSVSLVSSVLVTTAATVSLKQLWNEPFFSVSLNREKNDSRHFYAFNQRYNGSLWSLISSSTERSVWEQDWFTLSRGSRDMYSHISDHTWA